MYEVIKQPMIDPVDNLLLVSDHSSKPQEPPASLIFFLDQVTANVTCDVSTGYVNNCNFTKCGSVQKINLLTTILIQDSVHIENITQ